MDSKFVLANCPLCGSAVERATFMSGQQVERGPVLAPTADLEPCGDRLVGDAATAWRSEVVEVGQ